LNQLEKVISHKLVLEPTLINRFVVNDSLFSSDYDVKSSNLRLFQADLYYEIKSDKYQKLKLKTF